MVLFIGLVTLLFACSWHLIVQFLAWHGLGYTRHMFLYVLCISFVIIVAHQFSMHRIVFQSVITFFCLCLFNFFHSYHNANLSAWNFCLSALFVHVCVYSFSLRHLWQSLNVLLSNSHEIPECKISSHMPLVSDVGFSLILFRLSFFFCFILLCYHSLITATSTSVHFIIVIVVSISVSVVDSPVRFLLSFVFILLFWFVDAIR